MLLRSLFGALALSASLIFAGAVAAPAQSTAPAGAQKSASAPSVSKQDVKSFAKAHQAVMSVRKKYAGQAKDIKNKKKLSQMRMQMQRDMVKAVKDTGMDVKRYNQIARLTQKNPQVRKRVQAAMKK